MPVLFIFLSLWSFSLTQKSAFSDLTGYIFKFSKSLILSPPNLPLSSPPRGEPEQKRQDKLNIPISNADYPICTVPASSFPALDVRTLGQF